MSKLNPIILALDYYGYDSADDIVQDVRKYIGMVKIGLQLFSAEGQRAFSIGAHHHLPIFLDLKLNDIPTTVAKTVRVLSSGLAKVSGIHYISVHCGGGAEMCGAAVEATKNTNVRIVGITSLTSLGTDHYKTLGMIDSNVDACAIALAKMGTGITRFVCPPNQLKLMRAAFGVDAKLISPGIRLSSGKEEDHRDAATPEVAMASGADFIVVGRPITQAADPKAAAKEFRRLTMPKL